MVCKNTHFFLSSFVWFKKEMLFDKAKWSVEKKAEKVSIIGELSNTLEKVGIPSYIAEQSFCYLHP